jgi:hypothetical protein
VKLLSDIWSKIKPVLLLLVKQENASPMKSRHPHNQQDLPSSSKNGKSNGQTEGQVNRLKVVKRQMYGRAKFDLLRKCFLGLSILP